jgi:hypothetical protein
MELGRSVFSVTKRNFEDEVFEYKGEYPSPPQRGEAFRPL